MSIFFNVMLLARFDYSTLLFELKESQRESTHIILIDGSNCTFEGQITQIDFIVICHRLIDK